MEPITDKTVRTLIAMEVDRLRDEARHLEFFLGEPSVAVETRGAGGGGGNGKRAISPRVRALRRTQGQYMGFVRTLNAKDKARVRKVREARGYIAATALAKRLSR